jgi:hypothetical protein
LTAHLLDTGRRNLAFMMSGVEIGSNANWENRLFGIAGEVAVRGMDGANIFAIGFPTSFAFAELSAARKQSIGVFAFVARRFADFVKNANPLYSIGICVCSTFGTDVFVCGHSGHCFHSFILSTVSSIWQTGCK